MTDNTTEVTTDVVDPAVPSEADQQVSINNILFAAVATLGPIEIPTATALANYSDKSVTISSYERAGEQYILLVLVDAPAPTEESTETTPAE